MARRIKDEEELSTKEEGGQCPQGTFIMVKKSPIVLAETRPCHSQTPSPSPSSFISVSIAAIGSQQEPEVVDPMHFLTSSFPVTFVVPPLFAATCLREPEFVDPGAFLTSCCLYGAGSSMVDI